MTNIDDLISYHEARRLEAAAEISRIEKLPEGIHTTHEDHDKWIADWELTRKVSRDTIAYLQTFKKRGISP